jgi:hypothetical protein
LEVAARFADTVSSWSIENGDVPDRATRRSPDAYA